MTQESAFSSGVGGVALLQVAVWVLFVFWPGRPEAARPAFP